MTLLSEYNDAVNTSFRAKVAMALMHRAVIVAIAGASATDPEKRSISFAIRVLRDPDSESIWVARTLAQAGLNDATADASIQSAVDTNWAAMSWTRDQVFGV